MKAIRKNRFKKEKTLRRTRWRVRLRLTLRAAGGTLALAAVSSGFIFIHDYFTQSPQFLARDIAVRGNQRLSQEQVLTVAGVDAQTNILSLNLSTTRKRLLAEPWIADAVVSRQIPAGVHIVIREEQPLAYLKMDDGGGYLINEAGEVFKRAANPDDRTLPTIQGLNPADLPVSGRPDSEAFRAVMTLLKLTREQDSPLPYTDLHRILMDREIGATVYTGASDRAIKLGYGRYRDKCVALNHLMARLKRDSRMARCQVIDLFDVDRIVVTLAPAGPSGSDEEEV